MLLYELLHGKKLVLASKSPRRQLLLTQLGLPFEIRTGSEVDETVPEDIALHDAPAFIAHQKAQPIRQTLKPNEILIASDTLVCLDDKALGKPKGRDEAIEMLRSLSGKEHLVITGVALFHGDKHHSFSATTKVYFRRLKEKEIEYYVDKYQPYDKAGAYGIQEWIGHAAVERIEGSYYNVMGLPVALLYSELTKFLNTFS